MTIKIDCGECGEHYEVADEYAGRKGRCPKCQEVMVIPEPVDPSDEEVKEELKKELMLEIKEELEHDIREEIKEELKKEIEDDLEDDIRDEVKKEVEEEMKIERERKENSHLGNQTSRSNHGIPDKKMHKTAKELHKKGLFLRIKEMFKKK